MSAIISYILLCLIFVDFYSNYKAITRHILLSLLHEALL